MTKKHRLKWILLSLLCTGSLLQAQEVSLKSELETIHRYPALYLDAVGSSSMQIVPSGQPASQKKNLAMSDPVEHLSFFCRLEVISDRKTRIPVRVRLGTVDYVNKLEQKPPGAHFFTAGQTGNPRRQYAPH